jgi:hypothetical protein
MDEMLARRIEDPKATMDEGGVVAAIVKVLNTGG